MITLYYEYDGCPDMRVFRSYDELTIWLGDEFRMVEMFLNVTFSITKIEES